MLQHSLIRNGLFQTFLFVILFCGCSNEERDVAQQRFSTYSHLAPLQKHYPCFSFARRCARFMVAYAPESDLSQLCPDSLVENIDRALTVWEESPWHKRYERTDFLEYVLPYRVGEEPLEYYWRSDARSRFALPDSDDPAVCAVALNREVWTNTIPGRYDNQPLGYSSTVRGDFGKCDDRASLMVMVMRAHGIPSAVELIPHWGSVNTGHSFAVAILPNGSTLTFQDQKDEGTRMEWGNKVPKIYRKTFSTVRSQPAYRHRKTEILPPFFSDFAMQDVTEGYPIGQRRVDLSELKPSNQALLYLSVFSPVGWYPVACSETRGGKASFESVGTGVDAQGEASCEGHSIGEGILYLPSYYGEEGVVPATFPLIVSRGFVRQIRPVFSDRERVRLVRKYPLRSRILEFAAWMTGGVIEGANRKDFSDAQVLYRIDATPLSRMQRVAISDQRRYRYVRYRKPSVDFSLAEIEWFGRDGRRLQPELLPAPELVSEIESCRAVCDGDPLTYFDLSGAKDLWIGFDLRSSVALSAVAFSPRTDDNDITPGHLYELFYWDDQWVSLGRRTATEYELVYDDVPRGALLWLRNRTRGREERPFTMEQGRQVWW